MNSWRPSRRRIGLVVASAVVAAGLTTSAEAVESGHVRGTVSVPKGVPFTPLEVSLYRKVGDRWIAARKHATEVDSRGRFAVGGLRSGTYRLHATDVSYNVLAEYYDNHRTFERSTTFRVRRGHVTCLRPVHLSRAAHIRGRLTDRAGRPIKAAHVAALQRRDGAWVPSGITVGVERDGRYDVPGLRAGSYRLSITDDSQKYVGEFWPDRTTIDAATSIVVKAGQVVKRKDARLELGSRISGRVTADDEGSLGGDEQVSVLRRTGSTWTFAGGTTVPASGRYVVKGLAAGNYRVRFHHAHDYYAEEFWNDATSIVRAEDVVVPVAGSVSGKDAVVTATADPGGRVEAPDGSPLAGITVTAYRPVPGDAGSWEVAAGVLTRPQPSAKQANFRFRLVPGTYRFTFTDPTGTYVDLPLESAPETVVRHDQAGWPPVTLLQVTHPTG